MSFLSFLQSCLSIPPSWAVTTGHSQEGGREGSFTA